MTINTAPCEAEGRHIHPADHNHYGNQCTVRPTAHEIWDATFDQINAETLSMEPVHTLRLSEFDNAVIREAIALWLAANRAVSGKYVGYSSAEFAASMIVEELPFPALPKPVLGPQPIRVEEFQEPVDVREARSRMPSQIANTDECFLCGRGLGAGEVEKGWSVHLRTDGYLLPVGEPFDSDPDSQGWFPVGNRCARKIPATHRFKD